MSDQGSGELETHSLLKNALTLPGEAQTICDVLNEFRLPRAILHLERETFIAWNESFRERTGYSVEQLHFARHKDLIVFSEPDPDLMAKAADKLTETIDAVASVSDPD